MIQIGKTNTLTILRQTPPGMFLGNDENEVVLLPNKCIEPDFKVGDEIEFTSREDSSQKIMTEVVGLDVFNSFKELCEAYPPTDYGSRDKSEYSLMYKYYSVEDEATYGVLAIRLKYLG